MTLYPSWASGLVVIVLAYYSDNPRSSPDWEPNLGFVFLNIIILSRNYMSSQLWDREFFLDPHFHFNMKYQCDRMKIETLF